MTINQIICRAASSYPDALVLEYWDQYRERPKENIRVGDGLAEFIANELHVTYHEDATEEEQIAEAVSVMQSAADDLAAVANALTNINREREPETLAACAVKGIKQIAPALCFISQGDGLHSETFNP
jgi:aryl-alcohol dehydrogenase-like predicted oxidoreductase